MSQSLLFEHVVPLFCLVVGLVWTF